MFHVYIALMNTCYVFIGIHCSWNSGDISCS